MKGTALWVHGDGARGQVPCKGTMQGDSPVTLAGDGSLKEVSSMKIAIIGAGGVGATLGRAFAERGNDVAFGVRRPDDAAYEPLRALQRAHAVVITRLEVGDDPEALVALARPYAPGALFGAATHRGAGVVSLADGAAVAAAGPARVLTATGNPQSVARTAEQAGFGPVTLAAWRDHHWWTEREARRELERAAGGTLVLTRKDAVRWPLAATEGKVAVLEVAWDWVSGGEAVERLVFGEESR